jgi:hypothetical protein
VASPVRLASDDVELIDRLVRRDRTAGSTALLASPGSEPMKPAGGP